MAPARLLVRHPGRALAVAVLVLLIAAGGSVAGVWLWASHHLRVGRAEMQRYHTAEAVPHLEAVLSVWPRHAEALLLAARAARRSGALDAASRLLDRYQEARGDDENHLLESVFLRAEKGQPDSVRGYCQSLIDSDHPATPLLYEALARGFLHAYQPHTAAKFVNVWLQRQPDNPQALLLQGQVYDLEMRLSEALKSYRAALTADPTFDEARIRLCRTLLQLNSTEEARPHLHYLRRRVPNNSLVVVQLAVVEDRRGNEEEAVRLLEEVLARQPDFAAALSERGKLAYRSGHLDAAENWLRQAVQRDPSDHQARHQLYLALEKSGKSAEARQVQEQIRQMEKDMSAIRAIVAGKLEQRPHDADLHFRIGMISLRAGAVAEAMRWLKSALKEDPHHQGAHRALMEHYQRIGDFGLARQHRQQLTR